MNAYAFMQIYDFSSFFDFNYVKRFLSTVNKCIITITIIIMSKVSWKDILQDFNKQFSKTN